MDLGNIIFSLRKGKSLTQEAFANALNKEYGLKLNKAMVSKWENNVDTPSLNYVKYMAIFFNVSLDYMLGIFPSSSSAPPSLQLTEQEEWLIDTYRKLDEPQREKLLAYIEGLLDAGSLKKHLYESPVVNEFMNCYDSPSGLMVAEPISEYTSESRIKKDTYEPVTIAAHHDSDEWSEDELKEIEDIKKYAKSKKG